MKYYKTSSNEIRAIEAGQEDLVHSSWVQLNEKEIAEALNPAKTSEQLRQEANAKARSYLAETDWYVVRFAETGTPVPADITQKREEARAAVVE